MEKTTRRRVLLAGGYVLFWTSLGLFFSLERYLFFWQGEILEVFVDGDRGAALREALTINLARFYGWGILALLMHRIDRAICPPGIPISARAFVHLRLGFYFTVLHIPLHILIRQVIGGYSLPEAWQLLAMAPQNLVLAWFISGAIIAWDYFNEARLHEQREFALKRSLSEAKLSALRSQLDPHFLFNTLNSISGLVKRDPDGATEMISDLGKLLRKSVDSSENADWSLHEEMSLVRSYVAIHKKRLGGQLEFVEELSPEVMSTTVPALILQPLVENSIIHGFGDRGSGRLKLSAFRDNGAVEFDIEDDGVGVPEGWELQDHAGVGLSNTEERLRYRYGDGADLAVGRNPGGGMLVKVRIPLDE